MTSSDNHLNFLRALGQVNPTTLIIFFLISSSTGSGIALSVDKFLMPQPPSSATIITNGESVIKEIGEKIDHYQKEQQIINQKVEEIQQHESRRIDRIEGRLDTLEERIYHQLSAINKYLNAK